MNRRVLIGTFETEQDILSVTDNSRKLGHKILDVYAPYAVHGLDKAMGIAPSRLPWAAFYFGLFGAAFKVWFEYWTTWINWPINVGGKPWESLPAFVPVTFEVMVLFSGVGTVLLFFLFNKLLPWKKAHSPSPRVTSDHFVLVLEVDDAAFDVEQVSTMFKQHNAIDVEERHEEVHD